MKMPLPEGRTPLTDADMVILLHDIARAFSRESSPMSEDVRTIADRFSQLSNEKKCSCDD